MWTASPCASCIKEFPFVDALLVNCARNHSALQHRLVFFQIGLASRVTGLRKHLVLSSSSTFSVCFSPPMASQQTEERVYHPKDTIAAALKSTALTGGVGLFASAVQNTLVKQNVGPLGIFVRSGSTIGIFAAMGGAYEFVKTASANLREKEDPLNTALGGFFAGSILGLRARTFPALLGYGTALAVAMYGFEYTGGNLWGKNKDANVDKYEELEKLRKAYRTPAEDTFTELGEGRGIYYPGYAERRRERIKEAYGIDVPASPPPAS